jgi:hypothetical protein
MNHPQRADRKADPQPPSQLPAPREQAEVGSPPEDRSADEAAVKTPGPGPAAPDEARLAAIVPGDSPQQAAITAVPPE